MTKNCTHNANKSCCQRLEKKNNIPVWSYITNIGMINLIFSLSRRFKYKQLP